MTFVSQKSLILLGVVFVIPLGSASTTPWSCGQPKYTFAYANLKGTALLTLDSPRVQLTRNFDRAVCSNSRILEVRFVAEQKEGPDYRGRNVSDEFEQDRGGRFAVVNGRIAADEVCLLTHQEYLTRVEALTVTQRRTRCEPALKEVVPGVAGRSLATCFSLASFAGGARFLAVTYQPIGQDLLAAFVLLTKTGAFTVLLPAIADKTSSWRVDDGGKFYSSLVHPVFALASLDGSLTLGVSWAGAEGTNHFLYRTSPHGLLEEVAVCSQYTGM